MRIFLLMCDIVRCLDVKVEHWQKGGFDPQVRACVQMLVALEVMRTVPLASLLPASLAGVLPPMVTWFPPKER
jgi:hypothetical protein